MSELNEEQQRALEKLKQDSSRKEFLDAPNPWLVVYKSWWQKNDWNGAIFCALSPPSYREKALKTTSWDFSIGNGQPGFNKVGGTDEAPQATYMRYGNVDDLEPFVYIQHFHAAKENIIRLCEEFINYHNLWEDRKIGKFYKIEDDGSETHVATIQKDEVKVRTTHLRQFLAGRSSDLLLFIDSVKYSGYEGSLDVTPINKEFRGKNYILSRYANTGIGRSDLFSRLNGKKIIEMPPIEASGIWPFEHSEDTYPEFIVAEDETGKPVYSTCDPAKLQGNIGSDDGSAHYLTPVFFKRDVLQKYYEKPELYSVEDGYLRCKGLWGLRMDNDNPDHAVVYLGDLGRDLPNNERYHWKSYNVEAIGHISETNFQRSFMGEFADAQAPDLVFKKKYEKIKETSKKEKGWQLYKELNGDDRYLLSRLRIPLNESVTEFEGQVSILAKLLVDRLNEERLVRDLGSKVKNEKGLQKLERYLISKDYPFIDRDLGLLKEIQSLRSQGVAHTKSSEYESFVDSITKEDTRFLYIAKVLVRAGRMLDDLSLYLYDTVL
jgi:hypothetical protein